MATTNPTSTRPEGSRSSPEYSPHSAVYAYPQRNSRSRSPSPTYSPRHAAYAYPQRNSQSRSPSRAHSPRHAAYSRSRSPSRAHAPLSPAYAGSSPEYSPEYPPYAGSSSPAYRPAASATTRRRKNDVISDSTISTIHASAEQHALPRRRRKNDPITVREVFGDASESDAEEVLWDSDDNAEDSESDADAEDSE